MSGAATIGIDVGGTKVLASLRRDGTELWSTVEPSPPALSPDLLVGSVRRLCDRAGTVAPVAAIGLGFPGLVDPEEGRVVSSVILDGWSDEPLAAMLTSATGIHSVIDNDVNMAARGEHLVRAAHGQGDDLLFVAVGTGIGGALVLDAQVWAGRSGFAGEVGHMSIGTPGRCRCGRSGCVALVSSGRALEAALGTDADGLPAAMLSASAAGVVERATDGLAQVLADAMSLLDLPLVVLGGGVARHPGFVDAVGSAFDVRALPEVAATCRIEPTLAGASAGAIGAAAWASRPSHSDA